MEGCKEVWTNGGVCVGANMVLILVWVMVLFFFFPLAVCGFDFGFRSNVVFCRGGNSYWGCGTSVMAVVFTQYLVILFCIGFVLIKDIGEFVCGT